MRKYLKLFTICTCILAMLVMTACGSETSAQANGVSSLRPEMIVASAQLRETAEKEIGAEAVKKAQEAAEQQKAEAEQLAAQEPAEAPAEDVALTEPEPAEEPEPEETPLEPSEPSANGILIYIDPGHQAYGNYDYEPVGPGASETKPKVSSGTQGISTGIEENAFNLDVSFRLRDVLVGRGYQVLMTRESANVDMSNIERAQMANSAGADAFIRIHANGNDNTGVNGSETICMTPANPYNGYLYDASRALSDCVLYAMCARTGLTPRYVWETDTMSGINWCEVPVTIVEMGYMTNPSEDQYMATDEFRNSCAEGIADGIDQYFGR